MINASYQILARDWIIARAVKLWLWCKRADTIVCRDCGLEVEIEALLDFVNAGCLQCGGQKLKVVHS